MPAKALLQADNFDSEITEAINLVKQAWAVIIATPIYNAAYSGLLKTFLDLLPRNAFAGKPVLAIATGGSQGHMLTLDYSLKPVLSALGAQYQLSGVFASESDIFKADEHFELTQPVAERLSDAVSILRNMLCESALI